MNGTGRRSYIAMLVAAYLLAFALAAVPGEYTAAAGVTPVTSVVGHLALFAALAAFTLFVLRRMQTAAAPFLSGVLVLSAALLTELLQLGVPGRCATLEDFVLDLGGGAAAFLFLDRAALRPAAEEVSR